MSSSRYFLLIDTRKRQLLPATLILAASTQAFAQPTVDSNALPNTGFTANVQFGTTTTQLAPGSAGANATWNFATFSAGSNGTSNYTACPGGVGCSTFPGSTLVGTDNNGSRTYFSVMNGIQAITGLSTNGQNIIYSNPEDYIRTPMTFNSTFTDPFAATLSGGQLYRVGSSTNLVDGYGTLTTPSGTYNNVLRVKRTSEYRDSMPGFGTMFNYSATTYLWYSPAVRDYLFVIASLTSTPFGGGEGSTVHTAGYRTGVITSSVEGVVAEAFFQASPNPAQDRIALRWAAGTEATAWLSDLTGRALAEKKGRGGVSFDVDAFPRGLYMLRVQDEGGAVYTEKVTLR